MDTSSYDTHVSIKVPHVSLRNTYVVACRGDVRLGDPQPQMGWHKGQTFISHTPGVRTRAGPGVLCPQVLRAPSSWVTAGTGPPWVVTWQRHRSVNPILSGHWCHRGPTPCPSSNPSGLLEAPAHRAAAGAGLPRMHSGGTRAESGHHPGHAPATYEQSATSSSVGSGLSGHHVLVCEPSKPERLCPGQQPKAAVNILKTRNL